jgi:prolyl 3-hydroxylase /prolyl 3,4-dihydroxylase
MKRFEKPYVHYSYPNFLDDASFKKLTTAYDHLQFFEKESDLFHFFQTNELDTEPSIAFLKKKLNAVFEQLCDMKDTFYNIFASMYFKGDYLLCHDDVVDDRKYAFILYLADHPSADLVLYDETATKEAKRIKVKRNHLVLFEVSNISYHEVAMAKQDGRRSITGWLNKKEAGALRPKKVIPPYQPSIPKNIIKFNFNQFLTDEEYFSIPNMEYIFDVVSRKPAGPFYERKATKLELSECVVLDMKGYSLFSADFLHFKPGDYMLLNDPVNTLGEGILDVFILQLPNGDTDIEKFFINIIDENGQM